LILSCLLDTHSQKLEATNLQVDTFRDNVNAAAQEMQKHVKWVETQHEKHKAIQDQFEKSLHELRHEVSSGGQESAQFETGLRSLKNNLQDLWLKVTSCDEEILKLDIGFKSLSKFFRSEIKDAVSTSCGDLQDEFRKIVCAEIDKNAEGRHSEPAPGFRTPGVPQLALLGESGRHSEPSSLNQHLHHLDAQRVHASPPGSGSGLSASPPGSGFTLPGSAQDVKSTVVQRVQVAPISARGLPQQAKGFFSVSSLRPMTNDAGWQPNPKAQEALQSPRA
jgi:hypothetical protein